MKISQGKTQPKYLYQPPFLDQPRFFFFNLPLFLLLTSLCFYSHFVLKAFTAYFSIALNSHLHALYAIFFSFTVQILWTQERQLEEPYLLHYFIPLNFYSLQSCPFQWAMTYIQPHRNSSSNWCLWNNSRSSNISCMKAIGLHPPKNHFK